ncbi:MarR family winged helix-turn-helix transcriptional regulator [Alsobacter sp. SYSU M60028]|uniref:MarR family winged helix-turn-helix transcriptional regulator n=1 Tax=Alsobacter ponti TaxID=2962936 RepID=A0ABT1LJ71_9HYPH|nr:helix-turn-helix domain-containing protein [Alsobacter ponti]MCP8940278.1 MarR family winged helix-turn-helix transcriptional regulator [Alsobacter ponti]
MSSESFAAKLARLRDWENRNLPTAGTILGYDVVVFLAATIDSGSRTPARSLYETLGYSEAALRLHIQRLQRSGYLVRARDGEDGRNQSILLTEKFIQAWRAYEAAFADVFGGASAVREPALHV